jgi:hypothetical protein
MSRTGHRLAGKTSGVFSFLNGRFKEEVDKDQNISRRWNLNMLTPETSEVDNCSRRHKKTVGFALRLLLGF